MDEQNGKQVPDTIKCIQYIPGFMWLQEGECINNRITNSNIWEYKEILTDAVYLPMSSLNHHFSLQNTSFSCHAICVIEPKSLCNRTHSNTTTS